MKKKQSIGVFVAGKKVATCRPVSLRSLQHYSDQNTKAITDQDRKALKDFNEGR